jgi:hypothetical protein
MVKSDVVFVEKGSDLFPDMFDAFGRMATVEPSLFAEFRGVELLGAEVKSVSGEELEETFFTRELTALFLAFRGPRRMDVRILA